MNRSYSFRNRNPRKGQALLLAVLIMIFAALISITFITVVAVNIGQTGREEERDKARQAADAGVAFANLQITEGTEGLRWRPEQEVRNGAVAGPPDFNNVFYWTPFDNAQGWASDPTKATLPEGNFVKFPDPRSTNPTNDAPNYMVKVEKVLAGDTDNSVGNLTGGLRITSIGLSPDDPTTFYQKVAYKAGPAQSPFAGAMRSISNWDFKNGVVPSAYVQSGTATSLTVKTPSGVWPATPFTIVVGNPGTTLNRYIVTAVAGNTLTLAGFTPNSGSTLANADEYVEVAATLGAPMAIDFDKSGIPDLGAERVEFHVSKDANPGAVRANGSLVLTGNSYLENLRDEKQANPATLASGGSIAASGLIFMPPANTVKVSGTFDNGTTTGAAVDLVDSNGGNNFPFVGPGTREQRLRLITDGTNRLLNSPDPTRQTKPFTPPDITGGGNGFGRYRQMTKYSPPAVSGDPAQSGAFGYGQGIYINNPQDVERASLTSSMSQTQLQNLWFDSSGTTDTFLRAGTPLPANDVAASLEQQHLRGWIAPDEFLPRGALIEIMPDATLTITLDAITDGAGTIPSGSERFNAGPVPAKSWRDKNGNYEGGSATFGGVYRRTNIPWPTNGVIFAEGNIRIRGKATTVVPPHNLTVVSMNNIYIEGSLKADNKKILLLARRNVVVNPTRIVGRPHAQTRAVGAAASPTLTVRDGSLFSMGDRVKIGSGATYRQVLSVSGDILTLSSAPGAAPTDATVVALQNDPLYSTTTKPFYNQQTPYLEAESQVLQRRFWVEGAPTSVRLAMRHGAAERMALSVQIDGTDPGNLRMGNKLPIPPLPTTAPTQVITAEKILTVEGDPNPTPFPATPATDDIDALANELNVRYNTTGIPADPWEYNASAVGGYGAVPYRYLAGVGLRHKYSTPITPNPFPFLQLLSGTTQEFPVATSVKLLVNGANGILGLETGTAAYSVVNQFGFAPDFLTTEDALTVDRSFYNAYSSLGAGTTKNIDRLTTDSRLISNPLRDDDYNTLTWRFHDDALASFSPTTNPLPFYSVDRAKLENLNQYNTSFAFETLESGYELDINAYVYAQEGSWFVIPSVYFDERLKSNATGAYIDYNSNNTPDAGDYLDANNNSTFDVGEGPDLNHDGAYSRSEQASVYRFLRYNYNIKFTGAIMENKTALVEDPDGTGPLNSPVADWTDKWATVKTSSTFPVNNFAGPNPGDAFLPATMTTANGNFTTIEYNFDPSASLETLITQDGFNPPISPELIYQTG